MTWLFCKFSQTYFATRSHPCTTSSLQTKCIRGEKCSAIHIYYNSPLKARTDFLNESLTNMDRGGPLWGIERPLVLNGSLPRKPLHEGHLTCLDHIFFAQSWHARTTPGSLQKLFTSVRSSQIKTFGLSREHINPCCWKCWRMVAAATWASEPLP